MSLSKLSLVTALTFGFWEMGTASLGAAPARSVQGAWVQGKELCQEVFTSAGKGFAFRKPVDAFAPAFIISGKQVRTPQASCRIQGEKHSGGRRILSLACATSVSVSDAKASLEVLDDGTLRRYLNEQDNLGSKYERCR